MNRMCSVALVAVGLAAAAAAQETAEYRDGSLFLRGRQWPVGEQFFRSVIDLRYLPQPCGNPLDGAEIRQTTVTNDPVVIYTGNEVREVVDLDVWSPVGREPIRWTRWANSRLPRSRVSPFGNAHNWRHGYQWELTVALTDTGRVATVSEPQGSAKRFLEPGEPGDAWTSLSYAATYTLRTSGENMVASLDNGARVRFALAASTATGETWRPVEVEDADGNVTALTFDENGLLSRVADAGGHGLTLAWTNLPVWIGDMRLLHEIATAPPAAEWVEVSVTNVFNSRYVRFLSADDAHARIAEFEVYLQGSSTPAAGTVIGGPATDPVHGADKAFDADPSTFYEAAAPSGGFVGLDLGANLRIERIRYRAAAGHEEGMVGGKFQSSVAHADEIAAIVSVAADDGRQVRYEYTRLDDTALPYVWQQLTAVRYGDGTAAELTYAQVVPGSRPLVTRFIEPRYACPFADIEVEYFDTRLGTLGQMRAQKTPDGCFLGLLTVDNGGLHKPLLLFGDGSLVKDEVNGITGRPDRQFDAFDRKTTFKRDASAFVTNVTDALNRQTKYERTPLGNELSVQFPNGRILEWTRDDLDLPLMLIERGTGIGIRTNRWTRDALHRVIRLDHPNGGYETFDYNALGQVLSHRLPNDGTETFEYDAQGRRTKKTDAAGGVWLYAYNAPDGTNDFAGNLVDAVTDPRGSVTRFHYTERGLLARVVWPDNTERSMEYDVFGNLVRETDELGKSWVHAYDNLKRRISTTDPLGHVTQWVFRPDCYQEKPVEVILPSGRRTALEYDAAWRLVARTEAPGTAEEATTRFEHDAADNLTAVTEPGGGVWHMAHNNDDRMVSRTDPLGNLTSNVYDKAGNLLAEIRPDGTTWTNAYTKMDWKTHAVDPLGQTTRFVYNAVGDLTSVTDAVGRAHTFTYDKLGRRLTMKFPDASIEKYQFDKAGNMTGAVNRAGTKLRLDYDSRNRLLARTWSDGTPGAAFSYDAAGRVLSIVNTNSALSYAYDDAGRLLSETQALAGQPQAHTVSYGWDDDGRPAALGYPSGLEVAYAYGARGLMSGVSAAGAALASIARDANGRRAVLALANGTQTAYSFDAASQLTALAHANSGGAFATRDYDYNTIGLRTNMLSGIAGVGNVLDDYAHDPLDQLVRARYDVAGGTPQRDVQYNFDEVGNRLSMDENGTVTPYSVNDLNQYTSVAGLALTYSTNGNLVGGPGFALTYDAQNRLVQAAAATGTVTFAYDGRNRCVKRTVTPAGEVGTSVWFVWGHAQSGQWGLLEERDSTGDLAARYVHGERIDEILRREGPEGTFYYHHDALGSTVALTDGTGALVEQYRYDVYGLPTILDGSGADIGSRTSALGNRFLFTGREWLPELGLYDYRNRVYSPMLGRWLQPDPIGFEAGDVNLYRYCGNSAAGHLDPFGKEGKTIGPFSWFFNEENETAGERRAWRAHEAQHRKDWLTREPEWRKEQRAFGAMIPVLKAHIHELRKKSDNCPSAETPLDLTQSEHLLTVATKLVESDRASKIYWNEYYRQFWQKPVQ